MKLSASRKKNQEATGQEGEEMDQEGMIMKIISLSVNSKAISQTLPAFFGNF